MTNRELIKTLTNDHELKPCPFCGGEVTLVLEGHTRGVDRWFITRGIYPENSCSCHLFMESEMFESGDVKSMEAAEKKLIRDWNRRAEK